MSSVSIPLWFSWIYLESYLNVSIEVVGRVNVQVREPADAVKLDDHLDQPWQKKRIDDSIGVFFYLFLKDGSRTGFRAHFDSVPADSLRMPDPVVGALKLAPPHQGRTLVGGINSNRASVVVYRPAPWDSRTPGGSSRPTRSPCRVDWRRRRCCRRPPDRPSAVPVRLRSDSSQFFFPIPDETGPSFFHRHSTIVIPQPSMQKNNFFG